MVEATAIDAPSRTAGVDGSSAVTADRFAALDSLRGICAVIVTLFHFRVTSHFFDVPLVRHGWLFVDFFFVLSGFVICHAYGRRLAQHEVSAKAFMVLRLGRVYPVHIAVIAAMVAMEMLLLTAPFAAISDRQAFDGARSIPALLSNAMLLNSFGLHDHLTWNGPSWSIGAEVWTYAVFVALFVLGGRHARLLTMVAGGLALMFLLAASPLYLNTTYQFGFVRSLMGFALGVAVQTIYTSGYRLGGSVAEAAICMICIAFVHFMVAGPVTLFAPFLFAIAVWVVASEGGFVSRALRHRFLLWLGTISYSIYMVHAFVQARIGDVIQLAGDNLGLRVSNGSVGEFPTSMIVATPWIGDLLTMTMLALVGLTAAASYRWIELPGREATRRWVKSRMF